MSFNSPVSRLALLAGAAATPLLLSQPAVAQVTLPQIVVNAPSPIARPAPDTGSGTPQDSAQGTLPVVTDQFATVTVVPKEELERSGSSTLGDLLMSKPGITGSSFAPGASSRPVIRGLDNNRVRIQENGLGSNGVSDLGEDHATPIDPLAADRIEVIRGPATLRYGSQAIGGVVNATNNRIPETVPKDGFSAELRGGANSGDNGIDGAVLLDAGKDNVAIHADAFGRNSTSYRIPAYPYLNDPTRAFNGRQPNSAARTYGESLGGSYFFDGGYAGLAVSQINSLYHIPGIDGEDHNTRIDMRQTKITGKGEFRPQSAAIDAIRFWLGASDYKHNEIGFLNAGDPSSDGVRQTFTNKEQEARVEMQLAPFDLRFASMTTAIGVQGFHQELTAASPDGIGLFDPNRTRSLAAYAFNEFKFTETWRAQLAGRIETNQVSGSSPDIPSGDLATSDRTRNFLPKSGSIGLLHDLPWDMVGNVTAQYVERAPRAPELFSRGPHDATGTFDIGNPNLNVEVAKSLEIGLKRAKGPFRFEANAYYTRFDGFIFRRLTGEMCDGDFASCGPAGGGTELNQAVYSQRDAIFRGGEFQFQWDVAPVGNGLFGIDGQYDFVRATFTDGSNVPRIPPQRLGGGVYWRNANWLARVNLLHAFGQNNVSANETTTPGYDNLRAQISYTQKLKNDPSGIKQFTVGISGDNLLDQAMRNAVSYTKDEVLMPGRTVRVFASVKY